MRRENAGHSFLLSPDVGPVIKGKKIIIVDDVLTSGATILACAELIKTAGPYSITALTVARTVSDDLDDAE